MSSEAPLIGQKVLIEDAPVNAVFHIPGSPREKRYMRMDDQVVVSTGFVKEVQYDGQSWRMVPTANYPNHYEGAFVFKDEPVVIVELIETTSETSGK